MRRTSVLVIVCLLAAGMLATTAGPAAAQAPVFRIGDDDDLVRASIDVSQQTFAAAEGRRVVITRDDVFADSLAGTALAGTEGPILFVPGGDRGVLPRETAAEIARLLGDPPSSCGRTTQVYLLGSDRAVGAGVEEDLEDLGYCTKRMSGASRIETSVAIAREVIGSARPDAIILARADDWADAATGGAFAAASAAPVVLTQTASLHPDVAALLDDVRPREVFALGGTAALSEAVVQAAGATRISGPSRAGTASKIAEDLWPTVTEEVQSIVAINGYTERGWTYALMGAPFAARRSAPMLYVQNRTVPPESEAFLESAEIFEFTMVGPRSEIDAGAALESLGRSGEVMISTLRAITSGYDRNGDVVSLDGQQYLRSLEEELCSSRGGEVAEAEYDLGRQHDIFTATVGHSDRSASTAGTTRFEVFDDRTLLQQVDVGFGEAIPLEIDVSGVLRLRMVVTELSAGQCHNAVWGAPAVRPAGAPSLRDSFIADAPPTVPLALGEARAVVSGFDRQGQPAAIAGVNYLDSITEELCSSSGGEVATIEFDLSRDYEVLEVVLGIADTSRSTQGRVRFQIADDRTILREVDVSFGEAVPLEVDVTGVLRLRLTVTELSAGECFVAAIGDPTLIR